MRATRSDGAGRSPPEPSLRTAHPPGGRKTHMRSPRRIAGYAGILGIVSVISAIGAGPLLVGAADHLDAPTAKSNHQIDITDLYAFKSAARTTLIMNVNPLTSPANSKTDRLS